MSLNNIQVAGESFLTRGNNNNNIDNNNINNFNNKKRAECRIKNIGSVQSIQEES